jgi:hypothetical protein
MREDMTVFRAFACFDFARLCEERDLAMLSVLILAALYGGWRTLRSAMRAWHVVPRSNDDLIFF